MFKVGDRVRVSGYLDFGNDHTPYGTVNSPLSEAGYVGVNIDPGQLATSDDQGEDFDWLFTPEELTAI